MATNKTDSRELAMNRKSVIQVFTLALVTLTSVLMAPNQSSAQNSGTAKPPRKVVAPPKAEAIRRPRSQQESILVASELTKKEVLKERLLLRYRQIWNHYRFRNEATMTDAEKQVIDELMEASRAPTLSKETDISEIRAAIKANSVELEKRLRAEILAKKDIDGGQAAVLARANLAYLKDVMIKGLYNNNLYHMNDKAFRNDFLRMMPETALPDSLTSPELYPKTEVPPWMLDGLSEPPAGYGSDLPAKAPSRPATVR